MRFGIAIWNFTEEGVRLPDLIAEFAGFGFDTISFLPGQLLPNPEAGRDAVAALRGLGLKATVHGSFAVTADDARRIADLFGDDLLCQTFDAAMLEDSCGRHYDTACMVELLRQVGDLVEPLGARYGVEDFPLDMQALDCYRDDLSPLLERSGYGMLIDLGHLNLRINRAPYFGALGPVEYLRRTPLPIIEVHVHDNCGDRDSHAHLGFGTGDFATYAAALREKGFDGVSTIEIAPSFHGAKPAEDKPRAKESLELWRSLLEPEA